ncbi:MAG: arginine--tRNA ligase [Nanoarchaeota archaeon]
MKDVISNLLAKALKKEGISLKKEEVEKFIEIPPSQEMGDFAFPCFFLAAKLKQSPDEIALNIRGEIEDFPDELEDIQTNGPYINFFLNRKAIALKLIEEVKSLGNEYGKLNITGKKTMVEFPSPNTNKPLHVGHLINMTIGESISRISEFNGEKVIRANLNNDRGIHICKSMAAYKFYGRKRTPKTAKKKSDHFVGDFYVLFNQKEKENEKMELESHRLLQKWESGDKETLQLWKTMNKWALDGFKETYSKFGIKHDTEFFESDIYKNGREIVEKGLKDKIFIKKNDGAVVADLGKEGFGEKVLLRADGTSIYMTQDLYLAKLKYEKYKLDKSIYVVGNEQDYHFKVLFAILKKLGYNFEGLKHLSYGMINLPEGRMKSREGTVVDADDLIEEVQKLVKKELESRGKLSKKQLEEKSLKIALAAIKYILLKVDIKKDRVFNPKESIDFEGDTGSYILYSYARASSILKKLKKVEKNYSLEELEEKEISLVKKLSEFKEIVLKSFKDLNPSVIANYSYQLSRVFNEFYHACPVINSERESFRVDLVISFKQILKNSLYLLGIETLERM